MIGIVRTATEMALIATVVCLPFATRPAYAASARTLELDGKAAIQDLYATQPSARLLASKAKAILVFPSIVKAGFMFGGQIGEGVRLENNKVTGYYSSVAASYGLQAGIQTFGYQEDSALACRNVGGTPSPMRGGVQRRGFCSWESDVDDDGVTVFRCLAEATVPCR